jgi:thiamine biosynthesis protein ThiS
MDAMNLTINGESQISSAETLGALVEGLGMKPDRVAIELNREIVPRDQWPQTTLHDGDRLEIVHFVGGGTETSGISPRPVEAGIPSNGLSSRVKRGICSWPRKAD